MVEIIMLTQPSCMQCKVLERKIQALQTSDGDKFTYRKVNVLEDHSFDYLEIQGTPHLIIRKEGQEIFNGHIGSPTVGIGKILEAIR